MLAHDYNENMFNKDGTLNKNYNSSKVTGLISIILEDHSDEFFNEKIVINTLSFHDVLPFSLIKL